MNDLQRRPGKPLPTDAKTIESRGFSAPVAELLTALNILTIEAELSLEYIRKKRYSTFSGSKFYGMFARKVQGPPEHLVRAVVEVCTEALDRPLEPALIKYLALWRRTPEGRTSAGGEALPAPESATLDLLDRFLGQLWGGEEADLAEEFVRGLHDLTAVTPLLAKICSAHEDPGAIASLLAEIETRDESVARSVYVHLVAHDEAIAELVRVEPAAESLRAITPEQPPEPEVVLPPSAIDPLIGRGRRWAAQLRRGDVDRTRRELLAAAAKWQPVWH